MIKEQYLVGLTIGINLLFLLYGISSLSISYNEANILFNGTSLTHYIVYYSTFFFGNNDFALRLPFVFLHISSVILLYKIGKLFLKRKIDRVISIVIYSMLPGINSAALLVNSAYLVIFFTLLFVFLYMYKYEKSAFFVLILTIFIDNSFSILYLSLFFYGIFNRKKEFIWLCLILFGISMYMYGFDTGGKPKGYFLDVLGIYSAIFSPFLFLYFLYAMYRILIKEEKNILWYISFTTLILSLILALRQRLYLEDFAPFVVISIPLMVKIFFNSYRVRLPVHRKYHNFSFAVISIFLVFNLMISFFNKPLYYFFSNPKHHFAYKYHIVKDLANELKKKNVNAVLTFDKELALRLKFYGISENYKYLLTTSNYKKGKYEEIDIKYFGKNIQTYYLYQ